MKKILLVLSAVLLTHAGAFAQCANTSNIYSFNYNGHRYEIIKENKSWSDANACATARGGYLLAINSSGEQASVNTELANAGINVNNTKAPDGGNASYVWTAGNDRQTEGKWVWGNAAGPFWIGNVTGSSVSGAYTNWGSVQNREPDNFLNEQHALGLAITNWPNGLKGEWNDIKETNTLYYIVEFDQTVGLSETPADQAFVLFPNPAKGMINIQNGVGGRIKKVIIYDMLGRAVLTLSDAGGIDAVDVSKLISSSYVISMIMDDEKRVMRRIQIL